MAKDRGAGEEAFQKIIHLVLSHRLQPGDRIYETNLEKELAMSRTPIREALNRLVSTGFMEKQPGQRGYTIPLLSPDDMKEVFYTRIALERKAARRAAKLCNRVFTEKLLEINREEELKYYAGEKDIYASLNESFHMAVAEMSGNKYLCRYIRQLFWRSNLYIFFFMRFYNIQNIGNEQPLEKTRLSYMEHRRIAEAIAGADPAEAEKAMQEHLIIAYHSMLNVRKDPDTSKEDFDLD